MSDPHQQPAAATAADMVSADTTAAVTGTTVDRAGEPPSTARTGDLAGLTAFLEWMHTTKDGFGIAAKSVTDIRSAWQSARRHLGLAAHTSVTDLDPDNLTELLVACGLTVNTVAMYRYRLWDGHRRYRSWLAGDPGWRQPVRTPGMDTGSAPHGERTTVDAAPDGAARGDLDGLLTFLWWMQTHAHRWGKSPRTVENVRAVWQLAHTRLRLPASTAVDPIDVSDLAERITPSGSTDAANIYAARLAIGLQWHQRWRADEPDWHRRTWNRNPRRPPRTAATDQTETAATVVHQFPLRPNLTIAVELPHDLHGPEADLLHTWLRNLTTES